MRKTTIFLALAFLLVLCATPVYAQPALPHAFYGSAKINGADAPEGSRISATVDSGDIIPTQNPVTTAGGSYGINSPLLLVQGNGLSGTITFYVNGVEAEETAIFEVGGGPTLRDLTVPATAPSLVTSAASSVTTSRATLNGNLSNLGTALSVDVSFEWGRTTAYGNTAATATLSEAGAFSATLSGLSDGTTYHFRARAVGDGTGYGADQTFTTRAVSAEVGAPSPPAPPAGTTDVRGKVATTGRFTRSVTAASEDELCTLTIPKDTVGLTEELEPLDEITVLEMDDPPPPPEDAHVIGLAYDFGPDGATFDPPITLEYTYDPADIPEGVAEEDLVIAYYDEEAGEWVELEGCVVDPVTKTITAPVSHFTTFAIVARAAPPPPAPAAFSVTNLSVKPLEAQPKEAVTITVSVANTGGTEGRYTVVLEINGVKEAEKRVTVAAGRSRSVSFSVSKEDAGTYSLVVDGLSASFTVVAPAPVVAPVPLPPPAPPVPAPPAPEPPAPLPEVIPPTAINWPVLGGVIAGVVIIVALLVFFLIRRRRAY